MRERRGDGEEIAFLCCESEEEKRRMLLLSLSVYGL